MQALIDGKLFDTDKSQILLDTGVVHTGPPILAAGIDYDQRIYYKSQGGIFFRVSKQFTNFFGKLRPIGHETRLVVFQSVEQCVNEMQMWEFGKFSREKVVEIFGLVKA